MLASYLHSLKTVVASIFIGIATVAGFTQVQQPTPVSSWVIDATPYPDTPSKNFGSNISACADFTTSLSSQINTAATSMIVDSLTCGDTTLVAGELYGFKLGGREYVLGYVSTTTANTITYMTRGLSRLTATSSVTAQIETWGRGTSVVQTDAPILLDIANKVRGAAGFDGVIRYSSETAVSTTTQALNRNNLATAGLVADAAFSAAGVPNASTAARGVVQIATQAQIVNSTGICSSTAPCVISSANASSTYSATASSTVVATGFTAKIDTGFIATSTGLFTNAAITNATLSGTTTTATSTSYFTTGIKLVDIGKNSKIYTASGTFTPPTGLTRVRLKMCGGGGGGGQGATSNFGGGGAGGSCAEGTVDVSATTSVKVTVGALGAGHQNSQGNGSDGGTSSFGGFVFCTGGSGGGDTPNEVAGGGNCFGTEVTAGNVLSISGQPTYTVAANSTPGGNSLMGFGGTAGVGPTGYGGGGQPGTASGNNGADATAGVVIVTW